MKIDRLYTLSQFVDYLISERPLCDGISEINEIIDNYEAIRKYNNFLKQPLSKDMFLNPIKRPDAWTLYNMQRFECTADEMRACREYKEAENKVIFKDWEITNLDFYGWAATNKVHTIASYSNYFILFINDDTSRAIKTLHDLADATKGQLKLKNVVI